ncbi:hypothetical protein BN1095_310099 [Clostridioides difficile]|uniref:Uncharacterized protein n=1 Tax=Clostridioides difficile TaxID=1496 RepID=A0A069ATV4_CLODI|nr:hypothetical protein BN187_1860009 [Clostridioides difficile E12]CCL83459.1 hypothetical protein BN188_1360026 [Clostridioides difficile T19]CCL91339.1 hypothetical protein BN190_2420014 [Clostridioides difficile T14]CDT10574.1 hypothetical protein BN1095_310099 [Clostridioides difficile]
MNLKNFPIISISKSIKNNPIRTLLIWSKNIKDITGKTKDFTCLILTPPCKSHSLFPYSVLLNPKKEFRFINFTSIIIT